jgi:uncharacterized protein YoxC
MTRKLEELFDLPSSTDDDITPLPQTETPTTVHLDEINSTINKIDTALPAVRDLSASDTEMDDLAKLATDSYKDLMDLGMQVDSRFASEIFNSAGTMLGHAITAKTAKMNKKLKMIDLQLKKARLDQMEKAAGDGNPGMPTAEGQLLDRNSLLEKLLGDRSVNNKKE